MRSTLPTPTAAETASLRKTFEKYAQPDEKTGALYLTPANFLLAIAPVKPDPQLPKTQYSIFFPLADTKGEGKLEWDEFLAFERRLMLPDAEFDIAFRYFDINNDGAVSFDEFKHIFSTSLGPDAIPFNFDAPWVNLYLGKRDEEHVLRYDEFTQFMRGLQGERLRQGFAHFDKDQNGYITREQFGQIMYELARHKLSPYVLEKLSSTSATQSENVSYSECIAFHNILREMDIIEKLVKEACVNAPDHKITPQDFATHAARVMRYTTFSPMEVETIFRYASPNSEVTTDAISQSRLGLKDFEKLLDPKWGPQPGEFVEEKQTASFGHEAVKSAYYFALGGVAGAIGATTVYPIDLVKTRMQNQRSKVVGEALYKNSIDCAQKIYKNEGFRGFYRGLPPQLVGVAPEKAIKLTVNDAVREYAKDSETGTITVPWELIAGGSAGACQVIFTNPLEIIKIRLQMQGEATKVQGTTAVKPKGAAHIIKQLGLFGLYRGVVACLARDVPFSAIYFPTYAHLKKDVFHEGQDGKVLGYGEALISAAVAGMPAAYFTTPADVVKTRLQSEARKGETHYKGVIDAFRKIHHEEGFRALFKGGPARIIRSSPQFGVTLVAYEQFKKHFPFPEPAEGGIRALIPSSEEISRVRARNALKTLLDVHENFGQSRTGSAK